ncbi:MAG: adenylate/guanylate cyclase domain-containing protein [Bauldia sp.]
MKDGSTKPGTGEATEGHRAMRGERRVITALFCDVVNSTGLAENLDPEDWTEIMNGAFERLSAPILRYEGTVAKLMGDAVLAFFGAPVAHEDDPQRAVLAALDMADAIKPYRDEIRQQYRIEFDVRIGINTGPVVVGDVGSAHAMEYTAMGDAVNVAARMEQTAAPGTIQISGDTQRLVAPFFDLEPLGGVDAKGKSQPVPAYRVVAVKAEQARFHRAGHVGAPLIGRDRELERLKTAATSLQSGRGGIVTIIGEAGLGKSRLVAELYKEWEKTGRPEAWDIVHGVPYDTSRPFGLFQNFARQMFGIELDDPPEVIHHKVDGGLRAMGGSEDEISLCSVALERVIAAKVLHEAKDFPAEVVRDDIFNTVLPAWRQSARDGPRVFVIDDLQWADSASVDLLVHLFQLVEEVPILFLCVFRPERQSPAWQVKLRGDTDYPHRYQEIRLEPLDAGETDALISALLNITDLPADLHQLILRKTDGNPYFVEEVVRSLIDERFVEQTEAGLKWRPGAKVADIAIPDSIHALLTARIDRLDEQTKSTLQMASVIGRAFYYRVLQTISDSAIALDRQINTLERAELLREAARVPELEYMFRHDLARDAAYSSILNRKRREFHLRVAEAIEGLFPDKLEEHAHRLAQHFSLAGDHQRAMKYYAMAGEAAEGLHATSESADHYARALAAARQHGAHADEIARLEAKSRGLPAGG